MRGFPLLNLLVITGILALLVIPLVRINRPSPPSPHHTSPAQPAATGTPTLVILRFVTLPTHFSLRHGDVEVPCRGTGLERQATIPVDLAEGSLELQLTASWPESSTAGVVEIRAIPEGRPELLQNVWPDDRELEEWVRFSWPPT